METEEVKRELSCPECGHVVAVSYCEPEKGEPENLAHHWCCLSCCTVDQVGVPHCPCGAPIVFQLENMVYV